MPQNYLNDPAPEGMKYVLMEYTITGKTRSSRCTPGGESFGWNLADAEVCSTTSRAWSRPATA